MSIFETIAQHAQTIAEFIGYASVAAAMTKTKYDNMFLNFISVVVNFIAMNFKKSGAALENKTLVKVDPEAETVVNKFTYQPKVNE